MSMGTIAKPMAFFKNGVCVPLVTTPHGVSFLQHRVSVTGDGPVDHLEGGKSPVESLGLLIAQSIGPLKALFLPSDDPPKAGFEDRRVLVHVRSAEPHARLESQRVTGAQPHGTICTSWPALSTASHTRAPAQAARRARTHPRPCTRFSRSWRGPRRLPRSQTNVLDRLEVDGGQVLQHVKGLWALYRAISA